MRDLHNNIAVVEALRSKVVNDDTEGTGLTIDLKGYEAAEIVVAMGDSGDTLSGALKFDLYLQHGDLANASDMAAVTQNDCIGTAPAGLFATVDAPAEDSTVFRIGYKGVKRYIRVFIDTTGTHTNGTPIGAVAVLGKARHIGNTA